MDCWKHELEADSDRQYLLEGITNGFKLIEDTNSIPIAYAPNHKSALQNSIVTTNIVMDEISKGRYHVCVGWKPRIISPLGLVPKSNGDFRLIHDCSMLHGQCVNDITVEMDKQKYQSVDDAVALMKPGCFMAKVDISAAYRAVAIHPSSYDATGLRWTIDGVDTCMVDVRLLFGARPSPGCFHRISQCIKRRLAHRGHVKMVAYQDDFLVIGYSYDECLRAWMELINLILKLGFSINYSKLEAPSTKVTFLGILHDSESMSISLPKDKQDGILCVIRRFLNKTRATKRQMQSLAGKLNHAARVVRGGRTFLRRILDCIVRLQHGHHKCKITGAVRQDILWWHDFMVQFNGKATCIDSSNAVTVATDACLEGGGAFHQGDFYYVHWASDYPRLSGLPINYKEAAMAALCVQRWAHLWQNKLVYLYSDNQCAVSIINKCACRDSEVMLLLRDNFWLAAKHNVHVKAIYMPGHLNTLADTASRLHEGLGRILQLESLINEWHLCHANKLNAFDCVSFGNHMSLMSVYVLQGIQQWRNLKRPWMRWCTHSSKPPWHQPQRKPTSLSSEHS